MCWHFFGRIYEDMPRQPADRVFRHRAHPVRFAETRMRAPDGSDSPWMTNGGAVFAGLT
jgi:hypothetical protein